MRPLLTPEEMRRHDEATIAAGTPGAVLMERAGRALAREVVRTAGKRYGTRVCVVCGTGNNAGDGFVAARVLHEQGVTVVCSLVFPDKPAAGDAATHLERTRTAGVPVVPFAPDHVERADVIVDAIFGTGFHGTAEGAAAAAIQTIRDVRLGLRRGDDDDEYDPALEPRRSVVSADIPSGLDGATGTADGPFVPADVTIAMGAEKVGTALATNELVFGDVRVADIGIEIFACSTWVPEHMDVVMCVHRRTRTDHKRSVGSVAVLAGSSAMPGAALLTARAAARAGSGYVTLGSTASVARAVQQASPELLGAALTDDDVLGPGALDAFGEVLERADVLSVGPGLGAGDGQRALVERVVAEVEKPLVLDADALNALAEDVSVLKKRSSTTILTPHPAELARLLRSSTEEVLSDRLGAAREAARTTDSIVVLKGHRTLTVAPTGIAYVNPTGGPELATAGTGDVLTGIVAALNAGPNAFVPYATVAAVYVHGVAGRVARDRIGTTPRIAAGVLASDVVEAIPEALALAAGLPSPGC